MDECGYSMPVHAEKAVAVIDSARLPQRKEHGRWQEQLELQPMLCSNHQHA